MLRPVALRSSAIGVLLAALAAAGCGPDAIPEEVVRPVRTLEATAAGSIRERSFSGTAHAGQEIELSFRVSGRIELLDVRVGDAVRRSQLIARLEPTDFEIAVRGAEAELSRAQALARKADSDLERTRGLWENENASQNDLDAALANAQSARALVDGVQQALEGIQRQLGFTNLRAPLDGAIADVAVEINENVKQGQTVALMTAGARPEVEVAIPELLIANIAKGDEVSVAFDALPGVSLPGAVTEVGVAATGGATTFPVTVRLTEPRQGVRSGMAATVTFSFSSSEGVDRIHLPTHAVGEDRDGHFVFLVEPADAGFGVVRRRTVRVRNQPTSDGLEILEGVASGDRVVTAGVSRIVDGQRVRLLEQD